MATVKIKGLFKVTAKGTDYWYAWRGGPRVMGKYGSPEFIASYAEVTTEHHRPSDGRFRSMVTSYKASDDYINLAASTKRNWAPWLDKIASHFGGLRTAQFDRAQKIRRIIRRWRNQFADTPRAADMGMQVLSRVCSHAVDSGEIASNPCEGIKHLYSGDRSEIIWTDADIKRLKKTCSADVANAVDLAACTGLRLGDLVRVSWSHVGDDAIMIRTGKSRRRREAIIPLYDELRALLARIPKRATTILSSSKKRPWTENGFGSSFNKAKIDAGMHDDDLHFHDLRGTAATRFYLAGIEIRVIAEIMAWEEEHVEKIIRRYVGRSAATKALIEKLSQKKERRT